jgi:hypothetical protein
MLRSVVVTIVTVFWAAVLVLVGGRFFALLFGANAESEVVDRLYRHSDFWVKPFFGMFDLTNETVERTDGVFEPASLLALGVYVLAGLLVLSLLTASYGFIGRGGHGHTAHEV